MSQSVDIAGLVLAKIETLGLSASADYFGVSIPTISAWRAQKNLPNLAAGQKILDEYFTQKPPELWDINGKKVLVLLPVYREFSGITHVTLFRNYAVYGPDKVGLIPKFRTLIVEARNMLASMALSTDCEFVIYCDSDQALPCGNGAMLRSMGVNLPEPNASYNAISRIMSHPPDKKIVGGLYFGRNDTHRAQVSSAFDSPTEDARYHKILKDGGDYPLEEVRWVATGFMRIHRSVFETMIAESDKLFPMIKPAAAGRHWGFFTPDRPDQGEDVIFCERAKLCGIQSYLDPALLIGHVGEKVY